MTPVCIDRSVLERKHRIDLTSIINYRPVRCQIKIAFFFFFNSLIVLSRPHLLCRAGQSLLSSPPEIN